MHCHATLRALVFLVVLLASTASLRAAFRSKDLGLDGMKIFDDELLVASFTPPDAFTLLLDEKAKIWAGTKALPLHLLWATWPPSIERRFDTLKTTIRPRSCIIELGCRFGEGERSTLTTRLEIQREASQRYCSFIQERLTLKDSKVRTAFRHHPKLAQIALSPLFDKGKLRPPLEAPFDRVRITNVGRKLCHVIPLRHVFPSIRRWRRMATKGSRYPLESMLLSEGTTLRYQGRSPRSVAISFPRLPEDGLRLGICWYSLEPHLMVLWPRRHARSLPRSLDFHFILSSEEVDALAPSQKPIATNHATCVPQYVEGINDFARAPSRPEDWTWIPSSPSCRWDRSFGHGGPGALLLMPKDGERASWLCRAQSSAYPPHRNLDGNREWTLEGYCFHQDFQGRFRIRILSLDKEKNIRKVTEFSPPLQGKTWENFHVKFRPAPETWDLRIFVEGEGKGRLWVDDLGIRELEASTLDP